MTCRVIVLDRDHAVVIAPIDGLCHPATRTFDEVVTAILTKMASILQKNKDEGQDESLMLTVHKAIMSELHHSCCEALYCTREVHRLEPKLRLPVLNAFSQWRREHLALAS